MDAHPAWSMADASSCAPPAGVRNTTRFALASALTRRSATRGSAPMTASPAAPPGVASGHVPAGTPPGGEPGPPGSPGNAYTSAPPATRSRTAPMSSRSRERVAWATFTPRRASRSASSSCDRTRAWVRMSAICACRAALVTGLTALMPDAPAARYAAPCPHAAGNDVASRLPSRGCRGRRRPTAPAAGGLGRGADRLVQDGRQGGEELPGLAGAEDERRGEPDRVRLYGVHQEPGLPAGGLHRGRGRPGQHYGEPQAPPPHPADQRMARRGETGCEQAADGRGVREQAIGLDHA